MTIPKSITMLSRTIAVEYEDAVSYHCDNHAEALLTQNKIILQRPNAGAPTLNTEEDFFGEVGHWALHLMGEDALGNDEKFVHTLMRLIHQALKTGKVV